MRAYFKAGWQGSIIDLTLTENNSMIPLELYGDSSVVAIDSTIPTGEMHISTNLLGILLAEEEIIDFSEINAEVEACWEKQDGTDCWSYRYELINEAYDTFLDENPNYFEGKTYTLNGSSSFYEREIEVTISGIIEHGAYEENNVPLLYMNMNTIQGILGEEVYQVSVIVKDSFHASFVQKELSGLSLRNIYPNGIQSQEEQFFSIFQYITLGITFGFFLFVTYFIVYLVLRNIQLSKKKDYLVYRSIGASKRDLNLTTIYELVFATTIGFILTMALFVINENVKTPIPRLLRYLDAVNYMVSFLILTVMAIMLGNRFNKKIFNRSVITALKQE